MATLNLNNKEKIKLLVGTCLIEPFYRHCFGTTIFLTKVNFILAVGCNNENLLKFTLQLTLAKGNFN